ncbi:MAG: TPR repeat protein [Candidatus Azotimanducaceae bacterium]|jgi:TPR repeat protein
MRYLLFLTLLFSMSAISASRGVTVTLKNSESAGAADAGQMELYTHSFALVIGIDDYQAVGWPRLSQAVNDAEKVAAALRQKGFEVALHRNLNSNDLETTLEDFFIDKGANPDARLFVWYAGHGHTVGGEGYLIPADGVNTSDMRQFRRKSLSLRRFGDFIRLADSKHVYTVFDSCFAGTVFNVARSSAPPAITRVTAEPVRQFLTSGDAGQQVSDDGAFASLFVEALMGRRRADLNADGYLTAEELGGFLTTEVSNISNNTQVPRHGKLRDSKYNRGDFVFLASLTMPPSIQRAIIPSAPSKSNFSLDAITLQADQGKQVRGAWASQLQEMKDAHQQVETLDGDSGVLSQLKINAWIMFAEAFAEDNPYSTEDNRLRNQAAERINQLQQQDTTADRFAQPAPAPMIESEEFRDAQRTAQQGDPVAQTNLGVMYEMGQGVTQNEPEAVVWYRKAADQGYAKAQYYLGINYRDGIGVTQNNTEAMKWYRKATDQGYAPAQHNLAFMYESGKGVTQNYTEAVKWYRKAADQDYAEAQTNLGVMYEMGRGVTQDEAEAVAWYRKAADHGYAKAQYFLGINYGSGIGVTQSYTEAEKWYRKATDQEYAQAQHNLGFMYEKGNGVAQSDSDAVNWYRKAAEQGYAQAQTNLGFMYEKGKGVPRSNIDAVNWYRKAADQGFAKAQFYLGINYRDGLGVTQSHTESVKWYRKATDQGYADAQTNLGFMYQTGKGVNQSDTEAVMWYRKAADQGAADAQINLGVMYETGKGVSQDEEEAAEWYLRAADQGSAKAQYYLGLNYRDGKGLPKSDVEAVNWYRKAASQDYPQAQTNLGFMYEEGRGVDKDATEAVRWYRRAADQGFAKAQYYLGINYRDGIGVNQSNSEAMKWYQKAADQGYTNAQEHLDNM